jgi:hypothetical protein
MFDALFCHWKLYMRDEAARMQEERGTALVRAYYGVESVLLESAREKVKKLLAAQELRAAELFLSPDLWCGYYK